MTGARAEAADAGGRQALMIGRVADGVSGDAAACALALEYDPAGSGDFRPLAATLTRDATGWFAFSMPPRALPPATGPAPALRVIVTPPGRSGAAHAVTTTAAALTLVETSSVVAGRTVITRRLAGAPVRRDVAIAPAAVGLEGVVLIAGDPDLPAAGASVAVIAPPGASTTADTQGRFRLAALPPAAEVTIRTALGARSATHAFRPDYARPMNDGVFAIPR